MRVYRHLRRTQIRHLLVHLHRLWLLAIIIVIILKIKIVILVVKLEIALFGMRMLPIVTVVLVLVVVVVSIQPIILRIARDPHESAITGYRERPTARVLRALIRSSDLEEGRLSVVPIFEPMQEREEHRVGNILREMFQMQIGERFSVDGAYGSMRVWPR
jgi:hypothetical protein